MSDATPDPLARYRRQVRFDRWGVDAQRRLKHTAVTLVGGGALGSMLASILVRAGIGYLRLVDRDFLELDNLQRQMLYDERDVADHLPKAEAAARKLRRINSAVEVEAAVDDFNPTNAERYGDDADLLLDGTDNLETRYLLNDVAVKHAKPWVYGACVAAEGLVLPVLPRQTPCLRCLWPEPPVPGELATCDTAGILASTVGVVASLQALEALKILAGREDQLIRKLLRIDVWTGRVHAVHVQAARDAGDCPCCDHGRYDFLAGDRAPTPTVLCGRNAVQIMPAAAAAVAVDLRRLAGKLPAHTRPKQNEFLLHFKTDDHTVTLFADGRAIVQGTADAAVARSVLAKWVGM